MAKLWSLAFALMIGAGLWAAPMMAQSSDVNEDVGKITRGGGENVDTALGDSGLVVETDGFKLGISTRIQFRLTHQQEVANGNDGTNGRNLTNMRLPRAKTTFHGYIFEKEFQYELVLGWTNGGSEIVEQAWFRWAIMQYINVNAGQHKLPFNWEESASSGKQQFVERSYVNQVFNQDYAKGIWVDGQVGEDTPWLKYWFGVYNGVLAGNNDFRNADRAINSDTFSNLVDTEMMINLRLETHPMGEVAHRMNDMRGEDERDQILFAIGVGVNWFMSGYDAAAVGIRDDAAFATLGAPASGRFRTSQDTLAATIDGHFRWMGLSVDVAFFWRHTEFHNRGANDFDHRNGIANMNDTGFTFEVAYFILPDQFNVGIRFNMLDADDFWFNEQSGDKLRSVRPDTMEIGLSVNYYIHGDNLKLTFDVLFVGQQLGVGNNFNPLTGASDPLLGVYNAPPGRVFGGGSPGSSESDHNDLWIIRLQLQWIF